MFNIKSSISKTLKYFWSNKFSNNCIVSIDKESKNHVSKIFLKLSKLFHIFGIKNHAGKRKITFHIVWLKSLIP